MLHTVERIGSFAGLASFLGLAVFALLLFAHGRDIRRLRDWAGSAPEREQDRLEQTQNIAAQRAEELRELEETRTAEIQRKRSRLNSKSAASDADGVSVPGSMPPETKHKKRSESRSSNCIVQ